jgi:hypothetical protein
MLARLLFAAVIALQATAKPTLFTSPYSLDEMRG